MGAQYPQSKNSLTYLIDIPHFKEVIIMAMVCESCGYRSNEVKSGAGMEAKGKRISLKITDPSDLSRDILKVGMMCESYGFRP